MSDLALSAAGRRDDRIDVLRGIALVMIFINHAPRNFYETFTIRNIGFSDAAEAFVLLAGVAAGLAYGNDFRRHDYWLGTARILRRVWTLYLVQILITVAAIAVAAAGARFFGAPGMMRMHGIWVLVTDPLGFLIGIPLLTHQIGYVNILPIYLVLLALLPPLIWVALRWPSYLLTASLVGWAVAGHYLLNFPRFPGQGGWFLWLQVLTGGFLLISAVWMQWPAFAQLGRSMLAAANDAGLSPVFTAFNKTYLTAPRFLHILALAYFLSTLPILHRWARSAMARPFAILGRQSLAVFALGTVLAFAIQTVKTQTGENLLLDSLMLGGGLLLQFALAASRHYWPAGRRVGVAPT
ncbi:MAG: OpgC domain-containing protein [Loktanella sp.]|nr:OpgC domain-containing protein [Loktanella sp.]